MKQFSVGLFMCNFDAVHYYETYFISNYVLHLLYFFSNHFNHLNLPKCILLVFLDEKERRFDHFYFSLATHVRQFIYNFYSDYKDNENLFQAVAAIIESFDKFNLCGGHVFSLVRNCTLFWFPKHICWWYCMCLTCIKIHSNCWSFGSVFKSKLQQCPLHLWEMDQDIL